MAEEKPSDQSAMTKEMSIRNYVLLRDWDHAKGKPGHKPLPEHLQPAK